MDIYFISLLPFVGKYLTQILSAPCDMDHNSITVSCSLSQPQRYIIQPFQRHINPVISFIDSNLNMNLFCFFFLLFISPFEKYFSQPHFLTGYLVLKFSHLGKFRLFIIRKRISLILLG